MTRNSTHLASATFLASLVALAACIDGGGSSGSTAAGGAIEVSNMDFGGSAYVSASAMFIATVSTNGAPVPASVLPDANDSCGEFELPTPTPILVPIITTKDVGGAVNLGTGVAAEEITLVRDMSGDEITYNPDEAVQDPAMGTSYDVTLGGGGSEVPETTWVGAFKMPAALSFGGETIEIPMSGDMELTWDPAGADVIILVLYGSETEKLATCTIVDDGAFTLPASLLADLDAYGSITVQAVIEQNETLDGRRVNLVGRSGFGKPYVLVEATTPTPTPTGTATPTPTPAASWSASAAPAVATVDNGSVCDVVSVSQSGNAADVRLDLAGQHSYGASLRGTLQHNGQMIDAFPAGTFAAGAFTLSAQPVAGFTGSATGEWILCVIDVDAFGDTGTLDTWSVHD